MSTSQSPGKSTPPDEPRFNVGDRVRTNNRAPAGFRARLGFVTEIGHNGWEYRVEFEDNLQPTTGYLKGIWLEA
jgi:hypothetical protein